MYRLQGLMAAFKPMAPAAVSALALVLSALVSYFVTIATIQAKAAVQEKRIEIIEEKQKLQDQKTDKIFDALSQIGADVRVTRAEVRSINQRLDRLENRIDLASGRQL